MAKDKYDFISGLIESKRLTTAQRERILMLSSKEIKKDKLCGDELEKRIEGLEEGLVKKTSENSSSEKKTKKPRPKETFDLLSKFSSTDGGIKNLTHSFNYGHITYEDLMTKCKEEYEEGVLKHPNVPNPILKRISEFAFSEAPEWYVRKGTEKIIYNTGWSEPDFVKWYKDNNIHPAQDAKFNKEMITPFKETIQIRSDLGNLRKLLRTSIKSVFGENPSVRVKIDKSIDSAQFFTDVDSLGQAIYHIFIEIKKAAMQNFCDEVEICYEIINGIKVLKIIHLESETKKNINDETFLGGDLNATFKALYGLCNYDILAKFPSGYFRKKILSDNLNDFTKSNSSNKFVGKNIKMKEKEVKGFTHELKFY